jgi:hypothetical protein
MNIPDKFDLLRKQIEELTGQIRALTDVYKSTVLQEKRDLLKEVQGMKSFMKSFIEEALENVLREVVGEAIGEVIKNMKTQPNVYHEEVVAPKVIRERVVKKGLDSPNALIHNILLGGVQPVEVLASLSVIKEKNRQRWR